jgi:hypothetical protein
MQNAKTLFGLSVRERRPNMSETTMKKNSENYELQEEYDLARLPIVPRGRYAPGKRIGKNVIVLAPDIAQAFPNDEAVNAALRLVLQMAKLPQVQSAGAAG